MIGSIAILLDSRALLTLESFFENGL